METEGTNLSLRWKGGGWGVGGVGEGQGGNAVNSIICVLGRVPIVKASGLGTVSTMNGIEPEQTESQCRASYRRALVAVRRHPEQKDRIDPLL